MSQNHEQTSSIEEYKNIIRSHEIIQRENEIEKETLIRTRTEFQHLYLDVGIENQVPVFPSSVDMEFVSCGRHCIVFYWRLDVGCESGD